MWKILKTTEIFRHPRLTLLEDDVILPDGTESTYLKFLNKADGADIVAINEKNEVLLQKEYNHPVGTELWQFPGGFIDQNETAKDAAQRELLEESGYQASNFREIGHHHIYRRRISEVSYVFMATDLHFVGHNQEASELGMRHQWFSVDTINQMIRNGEITATDTLAIWALFTATYQK